MSTLLAILDKTFSDPRMPLELLSLQDMARASQLLRMATSAFVTTKFEMGRDYFQRALAACPNLATEHIDFLVDTLVYRIRGLSIDTPEEVLQQATKYLPGDNTFIKKLKRRLWGRFYEIAAFQSYQLGQRSECIAYVIRAVGQTPSSLHNRGLLSIFVQSLMGNQDSYKSKSHPRTLQKNKG